MSGKKQLIIAFSKTLTVNTAAALCLLAWSTNSLIAQDRSGNESTSAQVSADITKPADDLNDIDLVRKVEETRISVIKKVVGSVVAVYGDDRQGGGSGVIIDPTGIALTNHHVIEGAGVSGFGGLADGKLYKWKLIGTDPGGDIAIIQLEGKEEFPWSEIGNSDLVKVGDWALAMGNPFLLAEDQVPTVTLGVVSGIERYQSGSSNQLVYGNCIQIDSSINPGNSGGPLFNMAGEVIGINGRGSFRDRGRVNVGLGYAISSNQIKKFMFELLATKLVEHGTLDASFSDREGKVVCSVLDKDSPIAKKGLELGDELLEFEGVKIKYSNQFTNLICTLPETWPAHLIFKKSDEQIVDATVRLYGLPYPRPQARPEPPPSEDDEEPTPEQKRQIEKQKQMMDMMAGDPGLIRDEELNQHYSALLVEKWKNNFGLKSGADSAQGSTILIEDELLVNDQPVGTQKIWLSSTGNFRIEWTEDGDTAIYGFDGEQYWESAGETESISSTSAKLKPVIYQVTAMASIIQPQPLEQFGRMLVDGSDKANGQLSCRLKTLDERDDWFYMWLQIYDSEGKRDIRLVKSSSELDGDRKGGAVTYDDWQICEGIPVARTRRFVDGLGEVVRMEVKTKKCSSTEVAADWFSLPGKSSDERDNQHE